MYEGLDNFLAETTNVAVLVTDAKGRIVWCNRGFEHVSEYTFNEVRGLSPGVVLQGPSTDPETIAFMSRHLRNGQGFRCEVLNYSKSGREYWVAIEVHPVRDENGEVTNFTSIQYDITKHKETELLARRGERQQASLARLGQTALVDTDVQTLLEETTQLTARTLEVEMAAVLEADAATGELIPRAFVGWDEAALRNLDWDAEGQSHPAQTLAARSPVVAPDLDREERFSDTEAIRAQGCRSGLMVPIDGPDRPFGVLAVHAKHSRRFTVEDINFTKSVASLLAQAVVRADAESQLRQMHAELEQRIEERTADLRLSNASLESEIAERRRVEDALRASEAFLQSALDALSAHVAILDESGRVLAVNRAWRSFANENEFDGESAAIGMNYLEVCRAAVQAGSAESELMLRGMKQVLEGERDHFFLQYPCHSPDEERWFQARVSRFVAGDEVRLVVCHENITEAKEHERKMLDHMEALSHVQRLETMGEMSAALAHELNQPLAAISNYTSGSLRRLRDHRPGVSDDLLEAMRLAQAEANRAADIIKRMRKFSRNAVMQRIEANINTIVQETISLVSPDARLRSVTLDSELAPDTPPILADTIHMQQVLINLIRNAMDAMGDEPPRRRRVTVTTDRDVNGHVRVRVIDRGCGIDETTRERLFDPFVTSKSDGMGLGLAICRSIVEAHDGRIWCEPNPDGKGTVFGILIPAKLQSPKSSSENGRGLGDIGSSEAVAAENGADTHRA